MYFLQSINNLTVYLSIAMGIIGLASPLIFIILTNKMNAILKEWSAGVDAKIAKVGVEVSNNIKEVKEHIDNKLVTKEMFNLEISHLREQINTLKKSNQNG